MVSALRPACGMPPWPRTGATEMLPIKILHMESPPPLNPLGIKGVGEAGVIPIDAAVASAVEDAPSPWRSR
jgi:carbon-monoxide dehydrogenase large subunit